VLSRRGLCVNDLGIIMAKYKAVKFITMFESYKGLTKDQYDALNNGEIVEIKDLPAQAKEFVEEVTSSNKEKE